MSNNDFAIIPISLPTPFIVGDVWCYLLQSKEGLVLIDCGPKTNEAYQSLQSAFKEHKVDPKNIDQIWLTHAHPDHFGAAVKYSQLWNAKLVGLNEAQFYFHLKEDYNPYTQFFKSHDYNEDSTKFFRDQHEWYKRFMDTTDLDIVLNHSDTIDFGKYDFEVIHAPGHAWGHACFLNRDYEIAFAGDILIENISSNALINFDEQTGERRASLLYLRQSMQKIADLNFTTYSGHGNIITNPKEVFQKHNQSQLERFETIFHLTNEPQALKEIVVQLFPFAKHPKYAFLPISEVIGYLDWAISEDAIEEIEISDTANLFKRKY